jgi:osmotically-inducible protein OsmY
MTKNVELQKKVQRAIQWEPTVSVAEIGVTAKDGVVTLSGLVDSYYKKIAAERAAKKVKGVKAIAEDIAVEFGTTFKRDDTQIAASIVNAFERNDELPEDKVKAKVENGWVDLEGEVAWHFEKDEFEDTIKSLRGIKGITNSIKVKSESSDKLEREEIENALVRNWAIDARKIKVDVKNHSVKLTGLVDSIYEKEEAGRLAWNAKGVWSVDNELAVIY